MASMPPAFTAALPEAMRHIVDELRAEHGSIRDYVRSIGVSDATLRHVGIRPARLSSLRSP